MHDLQMARGPIEGGYNLAVGEPVLLQQHLGFAPFEHRGALEYPTMEPVPELLEQLQALHPGFEIVVANGAKQALLAALYAYHKKGKQLLIHQKPWWPSYKTIAAMSEMAIMAQNQGTENQVLVNTSPNNPDGSVSTKPCHIWDAVYAHWVYGFDGNEPPHEVRVVSAAKLLGLSGARIGWILTRNKSLADLARLYIEMSTSGVGQLGQLRVAQALGEMSNGWHNQGLREARSGLMRNGNRFKSILGSHMDWTDGVPAHGKGMFAYFVAKDPERFERARVEAKIALVTGLACGVTRPGTYRMNMMQDETVTQEALLRLKEEYLK